MKAKALENVQRAFEHQEAAVSSVKILIVGGSWPFFCSFAVVCGKYRTCMLDCCSDMVHIGIFLVWG